MFAPGLGNATQKTTSYKVVLPFYVYASISFLVATLLLFFSTDAFKQHYFHPHTLAITHMMTLGWGTMMIFGASHQLVPVLIEGELYSNVLAYLTFALAAAGIPLLVVGFFFFNLGIAAQIGAVLVNVAIIIFLTNLAISISNSKKENVHAVFIFTATSWLFLTTLFGLLLLLNFTMKIFSTESLHYLSLHAHLGILGWFLLLIIGVGSRLIPMFLISKYHNPKLLWWIYGLVNAALLLMIATQTLSALAALVYAPGVLVFAAVLLFMYFIYQSHRQRIRKKVDEPMRLSLLAVALMLLPVLILIATLLITQHSSESAMVLTYGFVIFFGWITSLILGMTFKTLPFIVWNWLYHSKAKSGKTPSPKDLFSTPVVIAMAIFYVVGLLSFVLGILTGNEMIMKAASAGLIVGAFLYNVNIFKILFQKPVIQ